MKANIPTAIRRKMSGRSLLRGVSGSARDQWGGNADTSAERGGGGGFGTDERPHIFVFFVGKKLVDNMQKVSRSNVSRAERQAKVFV
jgi:hypothetical protein